MGVEGNAEGRKEEKKKSARKESGSFDVGVVVSSDEVFSFLAEL